MKTKAKRDEIERTYVAAADVRRACKASYIKEPTNEAWEAIIAADTVYAIAWANRDMEFGFVGGLK